MKKHIQHTPSSKKSQFWSIMEFNVEGLTITRNLLDNYLHQLQTHLLEETRGGRRQYNILVVVKFESGRIVSLSKAARIRPSNEGEITALANALYEGLEIRNDYYLVENIVSLIIKYREVPKELERDTPKIIKGSSEMEQANNIDSIKIREYNLPNSMNYMSWGRLKGSTNGRVIIKVNSQSKSYEYAVHAKDLRNISTKVYFNKVELLEFHDVMDKNFENFTRTINTQSYIIREGRVVCKLQKPFFEELTLLNQVKLRRNVI